MVRPRNIDFASSSRWASDTHAALSAGRIDALRRARLWAEESRSQPRHVDQVRRRELNPEEFMSRQLRAMVNHRRGPAVLLFSMIQSMGGTEASGYKGMYINTVV